MRSLPDGGFVFANLVDFDSEFGHRRDIPGYAAALEAFDRRLPEIAGVLREGDLAIVTADHGNDPDWRGTDHTREHSPILAFGAGIAPGSIGRRETFADIGATVAGHLDVRQLAYRTILALAGNRHDAERRHVPSSFPRNAGRGRHARDARGVRS